MWEVVGMYELLRVSLSLPLLYTPIGAQVGV